MMTFWELMFQIKNFKLICLLAMNSVFCRCVDKRKKFKKKFGSMMEEWFKIL
jgi:hypothetical protein